MSRTVADMTTALSNRLRVENVTADVSSALAATFVREGYQEALGQVPLVRREVVVLDSNLAGTVTETTRSIFYVSVLPFDVSMAPGQILLRHQWQSTMTGIVMRDRHAAIPGQSVMIYYQPELVSFDDNPATVDTDSVFGEGWLEPYVLQIAARQAEQHMVNIADSAGGQTHGVQWRVIQDDVKALRDALLARYSEWRQSMEQEVAERAALAPPAVQNPLGGFLNRSHKINRLMKGRP